MVTVRTPSAARRPRQPSGYRGLLVGGYPAQYQKLRPRIWEEFGIDLAVHWETGLTVKTVRERQLPADVEVVLFLTDAFKICSKEVSEKAQQLKVPLVLMTRRMSEGSVALEQAGFPRHPAWQRPAPPAASSPPEPPSPPASAPPRRTEVPDLVVTGPADRQANAVQPPASSPAPVSPYQSGSRYFKPAGRLGQHGQWSDHDLEVLVKLAETGPVDAEGFCEAFAQATGTYRLPGGLNLHLRNLGHLCRTSPGLMLALGRAAAQLRDRKVAFLASEAALYRAGKGVAQLPEWISSDVASHLVGSVPSRLAPLTLWQDKETGGFVYRRDEVLARQRELEAQAGGLLSKARINPPPRLAAAQLGEQVRAYVLAHPGTTLKPVYDAVSANAERVRYQLEQLVAQGLIERRPHATKTGVFLYGPVGWTAISVPVAPAIPVSASPAPVAAAVGPGVDPLLAAPILAALQEGRLDAGKAAQLLKLLAG
jgi:hypothetical protein